MPTRPGLEVVCSLAFLAGCMGDADFRDRIAAAEALAGRAASAARSCADDLQALVPGSAQLAGSVLDAQDAPTEYLFVRPLGTSATTPETAARRVRDEVARRERIIEGDLRVISDAAELGPAALDRVRDAVAQAELIRARLCQARDFTGTLATMHGTRVPLAEAASSK